tara:strand:- start:15738 stop:16586 length:849 start_codon:yes stop_codon:yes gene_type:complete
LKKKEFVISGSNGKSILIDVTYIENKCPKKVVIFCHGFKGFKDWGAFNKIAEYFAKENLFFLKFNFSHNGTTLEKPSDFDDMEAFGNNNFCIELDDLNFVIDWILNNHYLNNEININDLHLLGHSRGGAISILKSNEDKRIKSVISWASPSNLLSRLPSGDKLNTWKKTKVAYIYNSRINKNMPMYYQFYENCILNKHKLSIEKSIKTHTKPHLVIHGSMDPTVSVDDALEMKHWNNDIKLEIIDNADHVFGSFHPYNLDDFNDHLEIVIKKTIDFLKLQSC